MKRITFAFLPFLVAGFFLPNDNCGKQESAGVRLGSGIGKQVDGPYIEYRNDQIIASYVVDSEGAWSVRQDTFLQSGRNTISFPVITDEPGKTFTVTLKPSLENEKNEFSGVGNRYIVSDIEGNFPAFRNLLLAGKVIDSNYEWTFGNGHLILTGDFVDRGPMQTEVLWLIYSLEEKAKAAGGYVHYILGNHEIMNLNGDVRYLSNKYQQTMQLMGRSWPALYGEQTELGRWLRTKNVVEKINDILFCHAGISAALNQRDIAIPKINKLVRPFYADSSGEFKNRDVEMLYSDQGPFWYRGYYMGQKASVAQLDSTLSLYKVKQIATGHTVVADTISLLYDGRLINTDVHHLKGHTEGLLIEEGNYYRVTPAGERFPIYQSH